MNIKDLIKEDVAAAKKKLESGFSFDDLDEHEKLLLKMLSRQIGIPEECIVEFKNKEA